jgi:hypothetical protein
MKRILSTVAVLLAAFTLNAAENAAGSARWIDAVTIAPIGAIKTRDFVGASQYGAGLDIGFNVNKFVSIHIANLSFEGADAQWGGLAVDETDILVKAKLARFADESFSIYGIAGAASDWDTRRWGMSAGVGVELSLSKHFSLAADYSLRAWFEGNKINSSSDSLARAMVNFSF